MTPTNHGKAALKSRLSAPTNPAAAVPIAIDCGHIILPIPAPMMFAAARSSGETDIAVAASTWSRAKRTLELVPDPVTNPPSAPTAVAANGYNSPVAETRAAAMADVMPVALGLRRSLRLPFCGQLLLKIGRFALLFRLCRAQGRRFGAQGRHVRFECLNAPVIRPTTRSACRGFWRVQSEIGKCIVTRRLLRRQRLDFHHGVALLEHPLGQLREICVCLAHTVYTSTHVGS